MLLFVGRVDSSFCDFNDGLVTNYVCEKYPTAASMEMETFSLFHLAKCCAKTRIHTSAASIVVGLL